MKLSPICICLLSVAMSAPALVFTNTPTADSFVRSNAPTANYGIAGSVTVSGSTATNGSGTVNGIADSFVRFNTAAMVSAFDSNLGTNNWMINGITLALTEQGSPPNSIFTRGKGAFEIRWIADDDWTEGTGSPMVPASSGIMYTNEGTLLNSNIDITLGVFTNSNTTATLTYLLPLSPSFVSDIKAGGDVSLFFTAVDPNIGFTFNSHNFISNGAFPSFQITAVRVPRITALSIMGGGINLSCTNGSAGGTYETLMTTNPVLPLSQWTTVGSNVLSADGPFNITVSNVFNGPSPAEYFIIETQ